MYTLSVINKSPQIQEKQVEITENGEITITPDAGFAYLNKVSVKTNVAQSGGGGSEGGDEYMYWDISNAVASLPEDTMLLFMSLSSMLFVNTTFGKMYAPSSFFITHFADSLSELYQRTLKIAFNMGQQCHTIELGDSTIGDFMRSQGLTDENLLAEAGISVITKEEFYTI